MLKRELANAVENNSDVLMWANAEDIANTTGGLKEGQAKWYTPPEELPQSIKNTLKKGERPDNLADRLRKILKNVGIDKQVEQVSYSERVPIASVYTKEVRPEISTLAEARNFGVPSNQIADTMAKGVQSYTKKYNKAIRDAARRSPEGGWEMTQEMVSPTLDADQIRRLGQDYKINPRYV